jgi:uncharacterized protein (DUF952 family)
MPIALRSCRLGAKRRMLIYHIVLPEVWQRSGTEPKYEAESLRSEGFIHCSYRNQLEDVLLRYYRDAGRVLVLEINPHLLTSVLVAERSTGGEVYPHIYGPIDRSAVVGIEERCVSVFGLQNVTYDA